MHYLRWKVDLIDRRRRQQHFSASMDHISYLTLDHSLETAEVTSGHACYRGRRAFWTISNQSICTHTVNGRFCIILTQITFLIRRCWCFPKEQQLMAASSSNLNLVSIWAESPIWFFLIPTHVGGMSGMSVKGRVSSPPRVWMIGLLIPVPPLCLIVCFFSFFSFSKLSSGAFLAGVPVQPVLLHYPNKLVSEVGFARGSKV